MKPGTRDIEFTRGDGYPHRITFVDAQGSPLYLVGMTFTAQMRRSPDDTDAVDFVVDDSNLAFGVLLLSLPDTVTEPLGGVYVWDLQVVDGAGVPATWLTGSVFVRLDVTRMVGS